LLAKTVGLAVGLTDVVRARQVIGTHAAGSAAAVIAALLAKTVGFAGHTDVVHTRQFVPTCAAVALAAV
jgi:acetylornithine deacetylase/succinyl-diaminopimelate desuccinylase-like protein